MFIFLALLKISEYMKEQNRPYSAIDVYTNLRQEFGKAVRIFSSSEGAEFLLSFCQRFLVAVSSQSFGSFCGFGSLEGEDGRETKDILC